MQNFSDPQNFELDFPRRPPNTLGIGVGTLWYAIGIYFGILKSHAKIFGPEKIWERFPTAPIQYRRGRDWRLWRAKGIELGTLKSLAEIFGTEKIWKRCSTAPIPIFKAPKNHWKMTFGERARWTVFRKFCWREARVCANFAGTGVGLRKFCCFPFFLLGVFLLFLYVKRIFAQILLECARFSANFAARTRFCANFAWNQLYTSP